jgi:hypothetical protein
MTMILESINNKIETWSYRIDMYFYKLADVIL